MPSGMRRAFTWEASFHLGGEPERLAEFMEELSGLPGHGERAMVTFRDYGKYWQGAMMFFHADSLSYWRKRKGFLKAEVSVHEEGRQELANRIRDYFHRTEGRGRNCVVEAYRRGELDYFFAYPEDIPSRAWNG